MYAGKDGPSSFYVVNECETEADEADALLSAVSPDMPGIFFNPLLQLWSEAQDSKLDLEAPWFFLLKLIKDEPIDSHHL